MSLTVLQIVQRSLYRLGLQVPSALIGATDNDTLQVIHLMYELAEELRNYGTWPQQKKVYAFDLESGRAKYPLPIDFYSPTLNTQYDTDSSRPLNGPVSDAEFTAHQYGGVGSVANLTYRIFGPDGNNYTAGGQFQVYPTPSASGQSLAFEYLFKNLFLPKYWQISTNYTSGQYVSSNGNIYLCDTTGVSSATTPVSGTAANTTDNTTRWDYQNIAYETILNDNDICIFDDDVMVAGLRAKILEVRNLEGAEAALANYKNLRSRAKVRMHGSFTGSFAPQSAGPRYRPSTPGSWSI